MNVISQLIWPGAVYQNGCLAFNGMRGLMAAQTSNRLRFIGRQAILNDSMTYLATSFFFALEPTIISMAMVRMPRTTPSIVACR